MNLPHDPSSPSTDDTPTTSISEEEHAQLAALPLNEKEPHLSFETPRYNWWESSKKSWFYIPSQLFLGGMLASGAKIIFGTNSYLSLRPMTFQVSDLLVVFSCIVFSLLPVWYYVTRQIYLNKNIPSLRKQLSLCFVLLLTALLLGPSFGMQYRNIDELNDSSTTLTKRSLLESLENPVIRVDELYWLQTSSSASYVPDDVFCPAQKKRMFPFFGISSVYSTWNVLIPKTSFDSEEQPPDAKTVAVVIARCKAEGAAMLADGHTKEFALMRGDIDGFFAPDAEGNETNSSVVLDDAKIPPAVLNKVNAFLLQQTDFTGYIDGVDVLNYTPGSKRHLTKLAIAAALGRTEDVARLK